MNTHATFFDIDLERLNQKRLDHLLRTALEQGTQTLIATPNPEMMLAAKENREIARILKRMHLRIPDGVGLSWMSRLTGQGTLARFPGVDVLIDLCRLGAERSQHLLILGGWGTTTEEAIKVLNVAFPNLHVSGISDVEIRYEDNKWEQPRDLLQRIANIEPDIIAIALGSSNYDKQERWIVDHVPRLRDVRIAIGVGGAIDMIAGKTKRAPEVAQKLGLEWLWRLFLQPKRIGRIYNAVVRFPIAVILDRIGIHKQVS